jgi:Fe-S cluster assembly scaffold protein SufB
LFYMMSKGISKSDSRRLMIQWIVSHMFDSVRDISMSESDWDTIDQVEDRVIQLINTASA